MAKITMQEEASTPATPSAGKWIAYFKAAGLFIQDDLGNEIDVTGSETLTRLLTTQATAAGTTTLTVASNRIQEFTGTTTQTIIMPDVTTLVLGDKFTIINSSTGILTVNSSGANLIKSVQPGTTLQLFCVLITGTTAASWKFSSFDPAIAIKSAVVKTSPADADKFGIWNSVTGLLNSITWANIKATLDAIYEPVNANIQSHIASVTKHGYCMQVGASSFEPVDSTTYYFGMMFSEPPSGAAVSGFAKVYPLVAGTINKVTVTFSAQTGGSAQAISLYIRKNGDAGTDTLIQTITTSTTPKVFTTSTANMTLTDGDYFGLVLVCPAWTTNPISVRLSGSVYIET